MSEKRKIGRPRGTKPKIQVILDPELDTKIRKFAKRDDRSLSSVVGMCVKYSIDRMLAFQASRGDMIEDIQKMAEFLNPEGELSVDPYDLDLIGQMSLFDSLSEDIDANIESQREGQGL